MSEPTFVPLNVGDTNDDDGQVFDDLFKANPLPPTPEDHPVVNREEQPKKPTRLIANSFTVPAGGVLTDPVQVAWTDPNRKSLTLMVIGAAQDFLYVADETTKLATVTPAGSRMSSRVNSSLLPIVLTDFTGPLYVKTDGTPMSAAVSLEVLSVTE